MRWKRRDTMNVYKKIVKKVIDYIEDNLENEIDLDSGKYWLFQISSKSDFYRRNRLHDLQVSANAQTYDCCPKAGRYGETDYPDCL